jgi:hypothetical protein
MTLATTRASRRAHQKRGIELIVHPGVDSGFIAWRAPFIPECRGFALKRKVKRAKDSAPSPNTVGEPDAEGFIEEIVASWVGFATRSWAVRRQ